MAIRIVRLGEPRSKDERLRIGTVRLPPRGVPKSEFAKRDFYDVWYPNLAPSAELVAEALQAETEKDWRAFVKKFKAEMAESGCEQVAGFAGCLVAYDQPVRRVLLRGRGAVPSVGAAGVAGEEGAEVV